VPAGCRPNALTPRSIGFLGLLAAVLLVAAGCTTASVPAAPRHDRFPLDPREDLDGPFADDVVRGCAALADGDASAAEAAFGGPKSERGRALAAQIGWIEAVVMQDRAGEAIAPCERLLASAAPTLPLLVGCGEAKAAAGDAPGGLTLYRRAVARDPARPGVKARAEELRVQTRDALISGAQASAGKKDWVRARADIAEAKALEPQSWEVKAAAGDVEKAAGDKPAALEHYREAMDINPHSAAVLEKTGSLALELEDLALAVSAYDKLARIDPRASRKAAEARLAFRVANWPQSERNAARSARLTRAGAAELVWWVVPEVRNARVESGLIASDAVSRRDSRAVTRAVALGLLEVDNETHRASPDAALTLSAGSKLLVRLLGILKPPPGRVPCLGKFARAGSLGGAEAVKLATACGLVTEKEGPIFSGDAFLRALDRARSVAGEEAGS
jgi:tetratricopeptide (TPR) repeat protein